jgi:Ca2+-binding EF-hand superfamily protein
MRYRLSLFLPATALILFILASPSSRGQDNDKGGFGGRGQGGFGKGKGGFGNGGADGFQGKGKGGFGGGGPGGPGGFQGKGKKGFGGPGGFPGQAGLQGPGFPGGPGGNPGLDLNQMAEADFNVRDRNGDGFLNMDEMPAQLKAELSKWDTNRDNLISLDEYKSYFAAAMQNRRGGNQTNSRTIIIEEEEDLDARPVVFRAGKLPKELPPWFKELDTDKDGQVALYEWRRAGKDLDEFLEWDRNNDGFITAEEALYKQRLIQVASAQSKSQDDATPVSFKSAAADRPMANSFGDRFAGKGAGKGKGQKGNFKRNNAE